MSFPLWGWNQKTQQRFFHILLLDPTRHIYAPLPPISFLLRTEKHFAYLISSSLKLQVLCQPLHARFSISSILFLCPRPLYSFSPLFISPVDFHSLPYGFDRNRSSLIRACIFYALPCALHPLFLQVVFISCSTYSRSPYIFHFLLFCSQHIITELGRL